MLRTPVTLAFGMLASWRFLCVSVLAGVSHARFARPVFGRGWAPGPPPPAGGEGSAREVRGVGGLFRESEPGETPPHPTPLPARGEREPAVRVASPCPPALA